MDYRSIDYYDFGVEMLRIGRNMWRLLEAKALGNKSKIGVRHLLSMERSSKIRTVKTGVIRRG